MSRKLLAQSVEETTESAVPFRTGGKHIWWIPDGFCKEHEWSPDSTLILYRDNLRKGVWIPEERLSPEWREKLELARPEERFL